MSDPNAFSKLVPGFDFMQTLVKNAGAALPGIGQWVAPTLDPEELEKRINELRTVQFWLEQNARMLGATVQALEVQRMTLSTLKTMNVQMGDLRDSLTLRMPDAAAPAKPAADAARPAPPRTGWPMPEAAARPAADTAAAPAAAAGAATATPAAPPAFPGAVDPMQWWTALTQQFTQLATNALKAEPPSPGEAATTAAGMPPVAPPAADGRATDAAAAAAGTAPGQPAATDATADTAADPSPQARKAAPAARRKPAAR